MFLSLDHYTMGNGRYVPTEAEVEEVQSMASNNNSAVDDMLLLMDRLKVGMCNQL